MSQIYIKEPPTNGKVLLKTTVGELDVELWSKETPLACRNFVQLCMEGYYNGTMFHRIIRDFIAQGGDPTGTGEGGESIYGHTFKDEFHSRLKFNRRGLVGMANAGRDDNGSQFFITLGRCDELAKKHTLFGKLSGDTLYNMLHLNDIPTDKEDRPLDPAPKILKTQVLSNPFDDIVPRIDPRKLDKKSQKQKSQSKATKNFSLLSFGEEAEEDDEETKSTGMKIKSSHDVLTEDPKLSAEPAVEASEMRKMEKRKRKREANNERGRTHERGGGDDETKTTIIEEEEEEEEEDEFDRQMREKVTKKLRRSEMEDEDKKLSRKEELQLESQRLKRELKESKRKKAVEDEIKKEEEEAIPEPIRELRKEQAMYKSKKRAMSKGGAREDQTLQLLGKFKSKLFSARKSSDSEETPADKMAVEEQEKAPPTDDDRPNWLSHRLTFPVEEVVRAKDANIQNEDTFDIYDPRNPLNKRRRGEDGKKKPRRERDRTET